MNRDLKEELLEQVNVLRDVIEREDIPMLINMIDDMEFDKTGHSSIYRYTRELLIEFISDYLRSNDLDSLKVNRNGEYQITTCDTYRMSEKGLTRNGHAAGWDSIGKLYQAYKKIRNIKL